MAEHIPEPYPYQEVDDSDTEKFISESLFKLSEVKAYTLSAEQLQHLKNAQQSLEHIYDEYTD